MRLNENKLRLDDLSGLELKFESPDEIERLYIEQMNKITPFAARTISGRTA